MSSLIGGFVNKVTGGDKKEEEQRQQAQPGQHATTPGTVDQDEHSSSGVASVGAAISGAMSSVSGAASKVVPDAVLEWKAEKEEMIKSFKKEKENMIKALVVGKIDKIYSLATNTIGEVIKSKIKDPYMPGFVQDLCDELVDTFWPDITAEAKERIISGIAPKVITDHGERPCPCGGHIVSFFRYYLMPYDRSIWRQIRNPLYLLFILLSLVPVYGIGLITYMLYFFLQDCKDQYMMQTYIVDFKALQFVSLGALSAVIGSVQYYVCVTNDANSCKNVAPKTEGFIMLLFIGQVFFVWAAFCFLRGAERKGGYKFQYDQATRKRQAEAAKNSNAVFNEIATEDLNFSQKMFVDLQAESEEEMAAKSVKRLTRFLIWDIIMFILCVIITCFILFFNKLDEDSQAEFDNGEKWDTNNNWKLAMSLYWVKAFYGLMSFPFAVLKLPLINTMISHAKPTGFNPWGNTVPQVDEEEPPEDCPWSSEYKNKV